MKRLLLYIWRILPDWLQGLASTIILPHFRVVAGAVIQDELGRLLLCQHTYRRQYPWGLPGGYVKHGEDPVETVRRELREETGLSVLVGRALLIENSIEDNKIILTYSCSIIEGNFVPNEEVIAVHYFDLDALPEFSPTQRATIEKALAVLKSERVLIQ